MQQGSQEQRTDEMATDEERLRLHLGLPEQRAQEPPVGEVARSVERMRLYLEQRQREIANAAEVQQQPLEVPRSRPRSNQQALNADVAALYIDEVKATYIDQPYVHEQFVDTLSQFKYGALDISDVTARISQLFNGNSRLIDGFNRFLPPDHKISK